jgi:hypothetical protein
MLLLSLLSRILILLSHPFIHPFSLFGFTFLYNNLNEIENLEIFSLLIFAGGISHQITEMKEKLENNFSAPLRIFTFIQIL